MLDVLNNKVELSNVHFAEHKLAIEDAKAMLENEGQIATIYNQKESLNFYYLFGEI